MIDEEEILRMAESIDQEEIYREVFELFGVGWELSIALTLRKMEFLFLESEPIDQDYRTYMECLAEAHN